MWQRFTERARRVVFFGQEEAGRLGENYILTEHLLLGLVREQEHVRSRPDDHVAARILKQLGVDLLQLRDEVNRRVTPGGGRTSQDMQLAPTARRVIDLSYDEARLLDNNYIGTEHLLLGLIREEVGTAGRILADLGVGLDITRLLIRRLQDEAVQKSPAADGSVVQNAGESLISLADRLKFVQHAEEGPTLPERLQSMLQEVAARANEIVEPTPGRGHIGVLRNDNERIHVECVPNAEDLPAFTEVMILKDEFAYRDLVTEGKILLLAVGTGAKFLRMERPGIACVRVLDGDHAGKIAYVLRQQLKETRPDDRPFPPEIVEQ
jgi:hypothetical protein